MYACIASSLLLPLFFSQASNLARPCMYICAGEGLLRFCMRQATPPHRQGSLLPTPRPPHTTYLGVKHARTGALCVAHRALLEQPVELQLIVVGDAVGERLGLLGSNVEILLQPAGEAVISGVLMQCTHPSLPRATSERACCSGMWDDRKRCGTPIDSHLETHFR